MKTLNLSHNKLGVASGCGLAKLLGLCCGVQELYLDSCGLNHQVLQTHISKVLKCEVPSSPVVTTPIG